MDRISLNAYAKLNLTLDVTGRRQDGYHLLRMVMQSIDLCDLVTVARTDGGIRVFCDDPSVPTGADNIASVCAERFFARYNIRDGAEIYIQKAIPAQAGMAGGSADGAAVLHALRRLYKPDAPLDALCEIGVQCGADIPFCLTGGTRLAEGVGELLSPLPPLRGAWFAVAKPAEGVSTRHAFAELDRRGATRRPDAARMTAALQTGDLSEIGGCLCNVLEDISAPPAARALKAAMLSAGAHGSIMTGSGSAVFGLFSDAAAAQSCIDRLDAPFKAVCRPCDVGVRARTV